MSDKVNNTSPPTAQASPPSIIIKLTERALVSVQHEAEARNVTVEKLALAALADFLGRNAKTNAPRVYPLVLHFPEKLRSRIVSTAAVHEMSVNRFVVETTAERVRFKLWKRHTPAVEDGKANEIKEAAQ